jgi:Flp pilus assembly secretin CpaC
MAFLGKSTMTLAQFAAHAGKRTLLAVASSIFLISGATAADLEIKIDRAQVFNIPVESKTLIIGNPAIADVSIIQPGLMVITGKAFGLTNLVSLDQDGRQIANSMLRVTAPGEQMVTVMRGTNNETVHCPEGGICNPTMTLSDSPEAFGKAAGQAAARQGAVGAAAPAQAPRQ